MNVKMTHNEKWKWGLTMLYRRHERRQMRAYEAKVRRSLLAEVSS